MRDNKKLLQVIGFMKPHLRHMRESSIGPTMMRQSNRGNKQSKVERRQEGFYKQKHGKRDP